MLIFVWGVAGAFAYASGSLILLLWNKGATMADRTKALAQYFLSLATGGIFAVALTETLQALAASGITLNGLALRGDFKVMPVAMTVGWSANYLWPKILRKLGEQIDKGSPA